MMILPNQNSNKKIAFLKPSKEIKNKGLINKNTMIN